MADRQFNVRLQTARDVLSNWTRNNPVLYDGEVAIVYDVGGSIDDLRIKIGDGNTAFNDLSYYEDVHKISVDEKGMPNGIATLDANGKIPLAQLPTGYSPTEPASKIISYVPQQIGKLEYTGATLIPVFANYDREALILSGVFEAIYPGTYTAIFTPAEGYTWSDNTTDSVSVNWTIEPKSVAAPRMSGSEIVYDGNAHSPSFTNYSEEQLAEYFTVSGDTQATDAGEYDLTVTAQDNYTIKEGV